MVSYAYQLIGYNNLFGIQMKKGLNKLIVQIQLGSGKRPSSKFKITTTNVNQYTNKILVDANQLNKPTRAQKMVEEQMKDYKQTTKKNIEVFEQAIKQKAAKSMSLQDQIIKLQKCFDLLMMEDVMAAIRNAKKDDLDMVRNKLIKLETHLSFKLEQDNLEPHIEEPLQSFLQELNEVINKTNKIY